ncbi:hypothetical protein ACVWWD_000382 [Mesorhizobium sp. URHB0026]|uniref:hypothetical protein n=1 Tax=Mesorhizobium australicum TaxID=536018 RepID=UPI0003CF9026|nr:hypothetical protein X739_02565 [Mesorhizobium sp. LNHC220B00]ESY96697.1 hypothetical protein X741_04955 [Mesorhizobium sp. LNHC229A00]ESZ00072.1 hypothetical protein X738_10060 [Mesorhizobium sp. LNHC209A00]
MMNSTKPDKVDTLALEQRISRTELAIERSEKMLADNIALRNRMRTVVEAAGRSVRKTYSNRAG